jgi:hypothetical protein
VHSEENQTGMGVTGHRCFKCWWSLHSGSVLYSIHWGVQHHRGRAWSSSGRAIRLKSVWCGVDDAVQVEGTHGQRSVSGQGGCLLEGLR